MRPTSTRSTRSLRRSGRLSALALALLVSLSLGACTSDNPMAPSEGDEGDQNGGGREPNTYAVEIELSHIKIVADCDKDPIVGGPNPGEFDYTISIWGRDPNGVYVKHREINGEFEKRGGQTYTLETDESFRVPAGKNYYVGFKATEKDGIRGDTYVGYDQDVNKTGGQLYYDHKLTIGSGGCQLELHYTAEESVVI